MRNLETEIRSDRAVPAGMGPRFRAVPLRGARLGQSWPSAGRDVQNPWRSAGGTRPSVAGPVLGQFSYPGAGLTPTPSPSTLPPPPSPAPMPGMATAINLTVFEPRELGPLPGAYVTVFLAPNPVYTPAPLQASPTWTPPPPPPTGQAPKAVHSGRTDENGKFFFSGSAPSPIGQWMWRLRIASKPGEGAALAGPFLGQILPDFPAKTVDVPTETPLSRAARAPAKAKPLVVVCPAGTDPLVCEVANLQAAFSQVYEQQLEAWNYATAGPGQAKIASFAVDAAHAAIENQIGARHPALQARWINGLSWAVTDLGIPPGDFPELIEWSAQAARIFNSIPFPAVEGTDWFRRCAGGIPIAQGRAGENLALNNYRLYSKRWSAYFPRTDQQIAKDMAARYLMNIPAIFGCMAHKMRKKAAEVERSAKTMSLFSLATTFMLAPMSGGAGMLSSIATEITSYAMQNYGAGTIAAEGITAAVAAGLIASGDPDLVIQALQPLVNEQIKDMDPEQQKAVNAAFGKAVDVAVDEITAGTFTQGAVDFGALQGLGTAIGTAIVKFIAGIPKMVAAKRIQEFGDTARGFNRALQDFQALVSGEELPPSWKPFLVWVADHLGLDELMNQVIDEFIREVGEQVLPGGAADVQPGAGGEPGAGGVQAPPPGEGVPAPGTGTAPPASGDGDGSVTPDASDAGEIPAPGDTGALVEGSSTAATLLTAGAVGGGALLLLVATGVIGGS